jgi:hypothetical protein
VELHPAAGHGQGGLSGNLLPALLMSLSKILYSINLKHYVLLIEQWVDFGDYCILLPVVVLFGAVRSNIRPLLMNGS